MKIVSIIITLSVLFLTGCNIIPKLPSFDGPDTTKSNKIISDGNIAKDAVKQLSESDRKIREAQLKMEQDYANFRKELTEAYQQREEVDFANFYEISKINYGIYYATTPYVSNDINFQIANLRSKENMARLDPVTEEDKKIIEQQVETERNKTQNDLDKTYKVKVDEGYKAAKAYDEATLLIEQKEAEKAKIRQENKEAIERLQAERAAEVERIQKETQDKINQAKEQQRLEMIGWIVKSLGAIGILLFVVGLLMKSPSFILSGILSLGLAYIAAMVPFWIIAVATGLIILAMIVVNPKTGKIAFLEKTNSVKSKPVTIVKSTKRNYSKSKRR